MFCEKCGGRIDGDSLFCEHCGTNLKYMTPVPEQVLNLHTAEPSEDNQLTEYNNVSPEIVNTQIRKNINKAAAIATGIFLAVAALAVIISSNTRITINDREIINTYPDIDVDINLPQDKSNPDNEIESHILYEKNGITVTAESIEHNTVVGDQLKLHISNESDKNIYLTYDALMVNDIMSHAGFSEVVNSGKEAYSYIDFSLWDDNIYNINKIGFDFCIQENNTYDIIDDPELVEITTLNKNKDPLPDLSNEVYNKDGIRICITGNTDDPSYAMKINYYIENSTDKYVTLETDKFKVNGKELNAYYFTDIYPGMISVDPAYLYYNTLEEHNIKSVKTVDFSFKITDKDYNIIGQTDTIHYTIK